jgi:hypothetical protein
MKLGSIIFVASSVASTFAAERGLQTLSKKWNITNPTFSYDTLDFDLDYKVSDYIDDSMTRFELFTSPGCKEEGAAVPLSVLTSNLPALTGAAYNADSTGDGVRDQKLEVGVVADTIAASDIYTEEGTIGDVSATVDFCVRFSIITPDGLTEVNFLETLVTLLVDLSAGFAIDEINVAPKIKLEETANQVYFLEGFQCDTNNVALTGTALSDTRNQGSVIRVCVKPDDDAVTAGIKMRSIDEFTFTRDITPVGAGEEDVSQPAVIGYNLESENGLTVLSCSNGVDVCFFETILFADFYIRAAGLVSGSGTGSMQFGTRRLRALQDADASEVAATSEFGLDFLVNPAPDDISGAAASGVVAATAFVMAAAFALL